MTAPGISVGGISAYMDLDRKDFDRSLDEAERHAQKFARNLSKTVNGVRFDDVSGRFRDATTGRFVKVEKEVADSIKGINASIGSLGPMKGLDDLRSRMASVGAEITELATSRAAATVAGDLSTMGNAGGVASAALSKLGGAIGPMGLAAVGASAVKAAWDLGTFALQADAVALRGKDARTSVDDLADSFDNLKLTIGRNFAGVVDVINLGLASTVESMAGNRLKALNLELQQIQANLAGGANPGRTAWLQGELARVRAEIESIDRVSRVNRGLPDMLEAATNRANELTGALFRAGVQAALAGKVPAYTGAVGAPNMTSLSGKAVNSTTYQATGGAAFLLNPQAAWQSMLDNVKWEDLSTVLNRITKGSTAAAKSWDRALSSIASDAAGLLASARTHLQGLTPGGYKDPMAPGGNGPFENLFRAKDVAVNGEKSPWAGVLGLDQATAQQIVSDFESGLLTPAIVALIDKGSIVATIQKQQLGAKLTEAFSAEIAKAAGLPAGEAQKFVEKMFGADSTTDSKTGKASASAITTAATAAAGQAKTALSDEAPEFGKIGANLITTLADELEKQSNSYLRTKAEGIASQLPKWVKDMLGISSPSKVFAAIGEQSMAGFTLGLEGGFADTLSRIDVMPGALAEHFRGSLVAGLPQLGLGLGELGGNAGALAGAGAAGGLRAEGGGAATFTVNQYFPNVTQPTQAGYSSQQGLARAGRGMGYKVSG